MRVVISEAKKQEDLNALLQMLKESISENGRIHNGRRKSLESVKSSFGDNSGSPNNLSAIAQVEFASGSGDFSDEGEYSVGFGLAEVETVDSTQLGFDKVAVFNAVYVKNEHRGEGAGAMLIDYMLGWCLRKQVVPQVTVSSGDLMIQKLLERQGFVRGFIDEKSSDGKVTYFFLESVQSNRLTKG